MKMTQLHCMTVLLFGFVSCRDGSNSNGSTSSPSDASPDARSDQELSEKWIQKRKDCGTYYPPQNSESDMVRDEFERCLGRCSLEQDCDKLVEIWCEGGVPAGDPFLACVAKCPEQPKDGYACKDGARVPFRLVCDGRRNCSMGEDEQGCTPYVCEDGQEIISTDIECNNHGECEDNSDEDGEDVFCPLTCQLRDPSTGGARSFR